MSVDVESRVKRANLIIRDEHLEQLFGDETSNRFLLDILAKKEGRMTDNRPDQQPTPEKAQRTAPTQPQKRFRLGVALAAVLIVVAVGVVFATVSNRGSTVAEVEPGPITSFEDFAGTYENVGSGVQQSYLHILEDGTMHFSSNRDLVKDRPEIIDETRFEGTKVFLKTTKGTCDDPEAIYEIHLLENGNLKFVAIEDSCAPRSSSFLTAEWAPVP
jgi:hypothetical protein